MNSIEQHERKARAEAAYKADQERRAALEAQQREDEARHLATLLETVDKLKAYGSDLRNPEGIRLVACRIAYEWQSAHEVLAERSHRLLSDPANYFEWAEKDMKAACKREVLDRIVLEIHRGKDSLSAIVRGVKDEITRNLLQCRNRPSSTSAAHNAIMVYRNEAQAELLEYSLSCWDEMLNQK
jgi:hypothetical protein